MESNNFTAKGLNIQIASEGQFFTPRPVPLTEIVKGYNVKVYSDGDIRHTLLYADLKANGLDRAVELVRVQGKEGYYVADGNNRIKAFEALGETHVLAICRGTIEGLHLLAPLQQSYIGSTLSKEEIKANGYALAMRTIRVWKRTEKGGMKLQAERALDASSIRRKLVLLAGGEKDVPSLPTVTKWQQETQELAAYPAFLAAWESGYLTATQFVGLIKACQENEGLPEEVAAQLTVIQEREAAETARLEALEALEKAKKAAKEAEDAQQREAAQSEVRAAEGEVKEAESDLETANKNAETVAPQLQNTILQADGRKTKRAKTGEHKVPDGKKVVLKPHSENLCAKAVKLKEALDALRAALCDGLPQGEAKAKGYAQSYCQDLAALMKAIDKFQDATKQCSPNFGELTVTL